MSATVIRLRPLVDRALELQRRAEYERAVADGYWPKVLPIPAQRSSANSEGVET